MSYICSICDGGPGNECSCVCGHQRWETTILGVTFNGRPMMGSPAAHILQTEKLNGKEAAERLLKAKNSIRKVWGFPPLNLQDDMTDLPMEGMEVYRSNTGGTE